MPIIVLRDIKLQTTTHMTIITPYVCILQHHRLKFINLDILQCVLWISLCINPVVMVTCPIDQVTIREMTNKCKVVRQIPHLVLIYIVDNMIGYSLFEICFPV